MAEFDPDSYLAAPKQVPASFDPDAYLAPKVMSSFNPDEYLAKSPSPASPPAPDANYHGPAPATLSAGKPEDETQAKLREEVQDTPFYQKSGHAFSDVIKDSEVEALAKQYDVSAKALRSLLPIFDGVPEHRSAADVVKESVGFAGEALLGGVPQKIGSMLHEPQMQKAIDELRELALKREGYVPAAVRLMGASTVGRGSKLALTALGGAYGFGHSQEGEELPSTLGGAGLSLFGAYTMPALVNKAGSLLASAERAPVGSMGGPATKAARYAANLAEAKLGKTSVPVDTSKAEAELFQRMASEDGQRIDERGAELLHKRASSESEIAKAVKSGTVPEKLDSVNIAREQLTPEELDAHLNPSTQEGMLVRKALARNDLPPTEENIERKVSRDIYAQRLEELASRLGTPVAEDSESPAAEALKNIQEVSSRQGGENFLDRALHQHATINAQLSYLANENVKNPNSIGEDLLLNGIRKLADAPTVTTEIGKNFGVPGTVVHNELLQNWNRFTTVKAGFDSELNKALLGKSNNGLLKLTPEEAKDFVNRAQSGGELSDVEKGWADSIRKYTRSVLDFTNEGVSKTEEGRIAPLSVPLRQNHLIPQQPLPLREIPSAFNRQSKIALQAAGFAGKNLNDLSGTEVKALTNTEAGKDLIRGLDLISRDNTLSSMSDNSLLTGARLSQEIKNLLDNPVTHAKLNSMASSVLGREGSIPDFLLSYNIPAALSSYTSGMLKHLYLREPIEKLKDMANVVESAGGKSEADYVRKLITDVIGFRQDTLPASFNKFDMRLMRSVDSAKDEVLARQPNPVTKAVVEHSAAFIKAIPVFMRDMSQDMHANLTAFNPRIITYHSEEPLLRLMPVLGARGPTDYGPDLMTRSGIYLSLNFPQQLAKVESLGLRPGVREAMYREATNVGRNDFSMGVGYRGYRKVADTLNYMANLPITSVEKVVRAISYSNGELMASDLATGNTAAIKALTKLPGDVRLAVQHNGFANVQDNSHILGTHFVNFTNRQYTRPAMSEFGRTMGPVFNAFMKWPSTAVGETSEMFRTGKKNSAAMAKFAELYVAPYAFLKGIDYMLGLGQEGASDRERKILGDGLAGGASFSQYVDTAKELSKGRAPRAVSPAAVSIIQKTIVKPLYDKDSDELRHGLVDAMSKFTAGMWIPRVILEDLPTYLTGERPQGADSGEREQEGLRELGR